MSHLGPGAEPIGESPNEATGLMATQVNAEYNGTGASNISHLEGSGDNTLPQVIY